MTEKIKILIADDHPIIRQGLRQIIERESDLEIIFECGDGQAALSEILSRQPLPSVMLRAQHGGRSMWSFLAGVVSGVSSGAAGVSFTGSMLIGIAVGILCILVEMLVGRSRKRDHA